MKAKFVVEILSFRTIEKLPGAWKEQDYISLLQEMDFSDVAGMSALELRDLTMMSLTDHEPMEAARIVLSYIFGSRLNTGQIANIANEMLQEKMWEEYADLSTHEEFFNANQLLFEAFNGSFPHPEAVMFNVKVTALDLSALELLEISPEASLIRLLIVGMPENTLIARLFGAQIGAKKFPEARDIIWNLTQEDREGLSLTFSIISSMYWFRDLKYAKCFEADTLWDD